MQNRLPVDLKRLQAPTRKLVSVMHVGMRQNTIVSNITTQNTGKTSFILISHPSRYFHLIFMISSSSSYTLGGHSRGSRLQSTSGMSREPNSLKAGLLFQKSKANQKGNITACIKQGPHPHFVWPM